MKRFPLFQEFIGCVTQGEKPRELIAIQIETVRGYEHARPKTRMACAQMGFRSNPCQRVFVVDPCSVVFRPPDAKRILRNQYDYLGPDRCRIQSAHLKRLQDTAAKFLFFERNSIAHSML
jgi:hypothetical protein